MKLRKTSENVNRTFSIDGQAAERIDSILYEIINADGQSLGSAQVGQGWASASISISGFTTIEEGKQKIEQILGD